ncbi:CxxxxCH/CxxCH domain c-type cytochrome [Anaeromyxobacter paludicola]|uniref:CxxxxCH/CxxCH domain c-type cytochrome n=1 Tax=Anaeromyxobacter paludicola TaxID=2918171 RepID=UPI0020BF16B6|nr:CxxxxCH/CxxCH domain-containing protein [Anaeromyxobacter paludicola]
MTVRTPVGGIVASDVGGISCGASAMTTVRDANGVLRQVPVYYPGADRCGPVAIPWSQAVVLTATPQGDNAFTSWSGDCGGNGTCTLRAGADKTVMAIFGPRGSGHPNYLSPADHGPAYLDYLGKVAGALNCPSCHGASLSGAGIAPSCHQCHAQAGWTGWQTNCSFCHGARTVQSKAGYDAAAHGAWSAPPDALSQRLTGTAAPARTGAHQAHLLGTNGAGLSLAGPFSCATCHAVPADLGHVRGKSARAQVTLAGAGQASLPASLGSYDAASGTCSTYCHGPAQPAWSSSGIQCGSCHAMPPPDPHPAVGSAPAGCAGCHSKTVLADGTIDIAGGKHVNGVLDFSGGGTGGSGCAACHGYPPTTGAHAAHYGLTTAQATSGYGDTKVLQDRFPDATATTAPAVYGFGCGQCHPVDPAKHMDGKVEVVLYEAAAPAGSLKARNATTATYDKASGTCSGVYCHSSGRQGAQFVTAPAWTSGAHLACNGCHDNPPRYTSGGAGSATANSHVNLADDGFEFGHFAGLIGPWLASYHGGNSGSGADSAPITCQTCHFETTDPANTGPSGFYYLDTTGNYQLPGGDPYRLSGLWYQRLQCTSCHGGTNAKAPLKTGKVLPLRHVNGTRDVAFDPRTTLPSISWLPAAPNTPTQPYWLMPIVGSPDWPAYVTRSPGGQTISFSLSRSRYDPATKTCTSVACHLAENPVWGTPYVSAYDQACYNCHVELIY